MDATRSEIRRYELAKALYLRMLGDPVKPANFTYRSIAVDAIAATNEFLAVYEEASSDEEPAA